MSIALFRFHPDQARPFFEFVLLQPAFHQRQRKRRAVYRDVDFRQEVRHRANVIFVAVRQDDGAHVLLVLLEERQVRHHQVDAQQFGPGEHHPAIDHYDVFAVTDGGHVHPELAQSAQGDYLQLSDRSFEPLFL